MQKLSFHSYKTLMQQSTYASKYPSGFNEAMGCGSLQCFRWWRRNIIHLFHVRKQIIRSAFSRRKPFDQHNMQLVLAQGTNWVHKNICLRDRSNTNVILSKIAKICSSAAPVMLAHLVGKDVFKQVNMKSRYYTYKSNILLVMLTHKDTE